MTSKVNITACLSDDKQVEITVKNGKEKDLTILQNGESTEISFYDDISIKVKEVLKCSGDASAESGGDGPDPD